MKRLRDDNYPPAKRSFAASRGESYGQTQNSGAGSGGPKLTTDDALHYLKQVKEMFYNQRDKYDQFLEVMKDFKAQRIDTEGVIARVKELFKGHNHLIFGFNTFLPKGYEITLDEDESPPKKVVEFEEAINFVNKIKKRFQSDDHVYKSFLEILNMYRREHKNIGEVYEEVSQLFEDHPDLLDEFTRFLPDNSAASFAHHGQKGRNALHCYDDRGAHIPPRHVLLDKRGRRDKVGSSHVEHDHSAENHDLDGDKTTIKAQKDQRRREKDVRDRRNRDSDDRDLEHQSDKRKASQREGFPSVSYDDKNSLKSMYNQEFNFCERVKEKLGSSDDYQAFLKCLHIYSTEIITRTELQGLVADLLGKYPDLMEGFNDFLEGCENIDGFLAGVMSKKSLWNDGHVPRSIKADDKDKEPKREIEGAKEKKEKYLKSIQDLDLSNCQRCTPSYRLLPDDYPIHTASQRSELGAQVLNDHWVSVTSGSEDYSFKHMRRNQYEESLFKCEDDRFELDMLLESVTSTARQTEDLLNSINSNNTNIDAPINIEDHFTALNIRCIERLYGDHGLDVMDIIRKHPTLALPVILTRLKQKQDEWTKCRSDFNKVWAEVYAKNHYKSLDHRSFYFKQQDSKNLSTKSLLAEIKERKENMQKGDNVLSSVAASYERPLVPHLELHYPDVAVHKDTLKLIKYSCEEVCSTKEQLNKVMSLWSTFLEPMLGVPCQPFDADNAGDVSKAHSLMKGNSAGGGMDVDSRHASDATAVNSKEVKLLTNGNEGVLDAGKICQTDAANGNSKDDMLSKAQPARDSGGVSAIGRMPQQSISSGALPHAGAVGNHGKTNVEVISGAQLPVPGPSHISGGIHEPKPNFDVMQSKEDADLPEATTMRNGILPQGPGVDQIQESVGHLKSEKEEGELSPIGDLEDDSSVVCRDAGTSTRGCDPCQNGNEDTILDNDVDGDDEDSENASEAGEDASGSESGDDECSREGHEEEDDVENDDLDGKADSESEADAHSDGGDGTGPPQSDRVFRSVKPLRKHISSETSVAEKKVSRIFYGNDDFYVMFMLHHILYERILKAKTSSTSSEPKWKTPKDSNSSDPYASFIDAVFNLLDGTSDNAKFEDDCRAIIGNQAYVLFTLDKLIYKLVKQLQTVATDDIDNRLLQLFDYEKSRKPENFIDSVYHENACVLLHDENIYRMEFSSSPARLSIQLMDNINEKSDMVAVSMEPTFSSYLHNQFLSLVPSRKEPCYILRKRNKRKYADLDESSALSLAMEDVQLFNGLEYKMVCRSSKIFYVLDTEDFFFRPSKRRSNLPADKRAKLAQARVERFNKLLLSVL